jgi:hypothetical protein
MKTSIPVALAALLAGCGGSNLSFSAKAGSATAATANALTVSNGAVVSRIRIVIRDLKLEKAQGNEADDSDDDEIKAGPFLLDLQGTTLENGAVEKVVDAPFTPGPYKEIKLKIHKPSGSEDGNAVSSDPAIAEMASKNASIIVDGTFNGAPFSYVTDIEAQQKFEGSVTLNAGSNITLNVDPTNWFGTAAAPLDPTVAANKSAIDNNIRSSFRAFHDDNHDGHDDESGH